MNEILPKEKGFQSSKDPLVDSSSFYCFLHTGRSGIPLFPRFLDPFLVVNIASNTLFYLGWINKTLSFIATMAKTNKPPLKKAVVGKLVLTIPKENRKVSAAVSSLLAETSPRWFLPHQQCHLDLRWTFFRRHRHRRCLLYQSHHLFC